MFREHSRYQSPSRVEELEEYNAEFNKELRSAQREWIKYRDSWARLLVLHRPEGLGEDPDIEIAAKTLLTKERTKELHSGSWASE